MNKKLLSVIRCPVSGEELHLKDRNIISLSGGNKYAVTDSDIILFAESCCSDDGKIQKAHYRKISKQYIENLKYPHTVEYTGYLDSVLFGYCTDRNLENVAEICCGQGEVLEKYSEQVSFGVGVDVSLPMLEAGRERNKNNNICFVQADATMLPFKSNSFDSIFAIGGLHHIKNRRKLFSEVSRVLKPGGMFFFREPVNDFFLWKWIRIIIYKLSSGLDYSTEQPLLYSDTKEKLEFSGFKLKVWRTCGFFGYCFLMNNDILIFNKLFRFVPGIRTIAKIWVKIDDLMLRMPGLNKAGLITVGVAKKHDKQEDK